MNLTKLRIALLAFVFVILSTVQGFSGASFDVPVTDSVDGTLLGFFDLRDRESFMQVTNLGSGNNTIHIQIYDVSNNCNENDFFDVFTPNDTHIYNLRDIKTNDRNDSGVVLPDGAYGVFIAGVQGAGLNRVIFGNLRIIDNSGYEYRTNLQGEDGDRDIDTLDNFATFNFNTKGGVTLSDIVAIPFDDISEGVFVAEVLDLWANVDVDIYDLNENPFSCRNVVFACVNENHPLLEELLEEVNNTGNGSANVASFEYGINNAIPHSKDSELLCPGNQISEGFVRLEIIAIGEEAQEDAIYFVGLNNGDGRGSMDAIWLQNSAIPEPMPE